MDATGPARILKGATAGALVPLSRRNGWASRAVRNRARAHPGLLPHPFNNNSNNNNSTDSPSGGGRPAPPGAHPTAVTTSSVPVLAITFGAVGGVLALVVILALVYVLRIRRRVKSMKRRTNVLGPGAPF
jgi:hypothetical protein